MLSSDQKTFGYYPILIVPHNRLLSDTTDKLIRGLRLPKPDKIVIIGPNHTGQGLDIIEDNTSDYSISTPREVVQNIFSEVPIKEFTLKKFRSDIKLATLYKRLSSDYSRNNTLYIFSIDFAHYLDKKQSLTNDKYTVKLVNNRSLGEIEKLSTDFTDCPNCLGLVSLFLTDQVHVVNNIWLDGTSYVWGVIK